MAIFFNVVTGNNARRDVNSGQIDAHYYTGGISYTTVIKAGASKQLVEAVFPILGTVDITFPNKEIGETGKLVAHQASTIYAEVEVSYQVNSRGFMSYVSFRYNGSGTEISDPTVSFGSYVPGNTVYKFTLSSQFYSTLGDDVSSRQMWFDYFEPQGNNYIMRDASIDLTYMPNGDVYMLITRGGSIDAFVDPTGDEVIHKATNQNIYSNRISGIATPFATGSLTGSINNTITSSLLTPDYINA